MTFLQFSLVKYNAALKISILALICQKLVVEPTLHQKYFPWMILSFLDFKLVIKTLKYIAKFDHLKKFLTKLLFHFYFISFLLFLLLNNTIYCSLFSYNISYIVYLYLLFPVPPILPFPPDPFPFCLS